MMPRCSIISRFANAGVAVIVVFCSSAASRAGEETALDRYVKQPDSSYAWKIESETKTDAATHFVVDLTSQTWRDGKDSDRPVWKHWVNVVKPHKATASTAFLFIVGGAHTGKTPKMANERIAKIAADTNTVAVELTMVPNQPVVFHKDGKPRKEDDLIAYTWDQYLKGGDDQWPARLPMVKSAVRAMDCVSELLAGERGGGLKVDKFVVAGGSKRGWTTWCTAAVDKRVVAIVPMVIDVLNVDASMRHHVAAYGFYSLAIDDYMEHKIMQRMNEPRLKSLYGIEDPFSYRDRLTMPKFIVNASGDEFFLPDSSQFYFDALPGEKYLRYVSNANHSLRDTDALDSIIAFYDSVLKGTPRPRFWWSFAKDGSIHVQTETKPKAVALWQAHNPKTRDFRVDTIGKAYQSRALEDRGGGVYVGAIEAPSQGWTAFFVELTFDTGGPAPLKLTTAVRVLPDKLPFADIDPVKAPLETRPAR